MIHEEMDAHVIDVITLQTRVRAANTIAMYWLLLNERRYDKLSEYYSDSREPSDFDSRTINGIVLESSHGYRFSRAFRAYSRLHKWYMMKLKQRYYHINHNRDVRTCNLPMRTLYYLVRLTATDGHSYPMIAYIDHDTLPSSLPHDLTVVPEPEPTHSAQQSCTHSASTAAPAAAPV